MRLQNVERSEVTADSLHVYLNGQKDIDKKGRPSDIRMAFRRRKSVKTMYI